MNAVVADTHAALWFMQNDARLSPAARAALDQADETGVGVYVSAISLIEVIYLVEKGRLPAELLGRFEADLDDPAGTFILVPVDRAVATAVAAVPLAEVRELPDRVIAATARFLGIPLVTADAQLQRSGVETIW